MRGRDRPGYFLRGGLVEVERMLELALAERLHAPHILRASRRTPYQRREAGRRSRGSAQRLGHDLVALPIEGHVSGDITRAAVAESGDKMRGCLIFRPVFLEQESCPALAVARDIGVEHAEAGRMDRVPVERADRPRRAAIV